MLKKKSEKQQDTNQKKQPDEKEKELLDCKDQLLRLRAEFENYKKQLDRQYSESVKNANASLIKELLPIVDTLEIALIEIKKKDAQTAHGIELIYKDMIKILEKNGLRAIDCVGKKFDPYCHEVMMHEQSEKDEGMITEEFQKGYMLNGKILRHSKVKISKSKSGGK